MSDEAPRKYWFPAKRYGWGWGEPTCWQGWAVLFGYIALMIAGPLCFRLPAQGLACAGYLIVITLLFVLVCWRTGEPPRWRWGDQPRTDPETQRKGSKPPPR